MLKLVTATLLAAIMMLSMSEQAIAGCWQQGARGNCSDCNTATTSSDSWKKFQADTINLRQEMMTKRFEYQRENLKAAPDNTKLSKLNTEINLLQSQIQDIRTKSGLPTGKGNGECSPSSMRGCGKTSMGNCNGSMGRQLL